MCFSVALSRCKQSRDHRAQPCHHARPAVNFFKRIEVIILLLLAAGGAAFVLLSDHGSPDAGAPDEPPPPAGGAGASETDQLHRITIERDFGNARLDLEVRVVNRGTSKLVLQPPLVRLLTGDGREAPPFFLPFNPPAEVPAGSAQTVRLRYWLERADLNGALRLAIADESLEVKSAAPFDLDTLENKKPVVLGGAAWKH